MTDDTAAALWSAIDAYGCDAASHGALGKDATTRAAIDRAITAHVEAEISRRLAVATEVEAAIGDLLGQVGCAPHHRETLAAALRAAIAADKARSVDLDAVDLDAIALAADLIGRHLAPTSDVARGAVTRLEAMLAGKPARLTPDEAEALVERFEGLAQWQSPGYDAARAALLRALGVEA